jgi:hypothetical protein
MFQDDADVFANVPAERFPRHGRRTKLAEMFLEQLFADWRQHGAETIAQVRKEKPDQYLKLLVAMLPRQVDSEESALDGLTDEQLAIIVAAARDALGLSAPGTDAARPPLGPEPAPAIQALSEAARVP